MQTGCGSQLPASSPKGPIDPIFFSSFVFCLFFGWASPFTTCPGQSDSSIDPWLINISCKAKYLRHQTSAPAFPSCHARAEADCVVFFTVKQSGSVGFSGGRCAVKWVCASSHGRRLSRYSLVSSFYQQRFCFGTVGGSWAVKCQSMWTWAGVDGWVGPEEEEEEGGRRGQGTLSFANTLVKRSPGEQRLDALPARLPGAILFRGSNFCRSHLSSLPEFKTKQKYIYPVFLSQEKNLQNFHVVSSLLTDGGNSA